VKDLAAYTTDTRRTAHGGIEYFKFFHNYSASFWFDGVGNRTKVALKAGMLGKHKRENAKADRLED
jgi:hypothetical protein